MTTHRKPLLQLGGASIVGFALAFVLFAAGHQLIYPALCAIDGTLWATWAQALFILLSGVAATWVVFYQLGRLADSERLKLTLALIEECEHRKRPFATGLKTPLELTVHEAISYVEEIGLNKEALAAFAKGRTLVNGKEPESARRMLSELTSSMQMRAFLSLTTSPRSAL